MQTYMQIGIHCFGSACKVTTPHNNPTCKENGTLNLTQVSLSTLCLLDRSYSGFWLKLLSLRKLGVLLF